MNDKKSRDKVRKDIKSMVIKPVSESGGYGIVIGKNLKNSKDIEATFRKIRNNLEIMWLKNLFPSLPLQRSLKERSNPDI